MSIDDSGMSLRSSIGENLLGRSQTVDRIKPAKPSFRVKTIKQLSFFQFQTEFIKFAKSLNFRSSFEENIFSIDDILVEMAVLRTNDAECNDQVFFFRVKMDNHKWRYVNYC
jgi:hypothetical protein